MATSNIARTEESDQNVSLLASLPFQVIDDGCLRHPSLESREIRLVTLLRGNSNEQLECRMENFRIDQCHYYEALSYVWGDNSELNPLRVNNAWFQITRNLFEALHQLRSSDRDRSLWIDQLCIDQTDLDERAAQVEMMGDIYKQANQVLCWLGPDGDEEADLASDLIQEMLRADLDIHAEGVIRLSGGYGNIDDTILKEINLPVLASRKWTALNHLIQHPYFERVWIMQEVKLASSKILLWGDSELSWDDLLKVLPWGLNIGTHALLEDSLLDLDAITRVLSLAEKTTTFEQCLAAAAVRKSTVAVDKIFAILNLVEGGAPFPADYNRTLLEAYRYTSMNLLQNRGNLKFMSHIDNSFINENDFHDWPSWVPRTWKGVKGPGEPDFTASSRFPLYTFLLEIDTSYLTLRGVKEGNVKIIGSAISSKPNRSNNGNDYQTDLETTALKIAEAWDLLRKHAKSFRDPGEPLFKAFIRTLISLNSGA
ncbi:heterokaryon incompatibility protein-domain-containing protein [Cadophora sp. MPI-SDFR-AT-0126]|nr:heterokaryon incompatibility protein-domain-containing protein [Leotiomycetes sp. MPI-SDFR-AT-0126]